MLEKNLEEITRTFSESISKRLEHLGLTRTDFAKRLGTSRAYVSLLLNGRTNLTLKTLLKVADTLDLNLAIVFTPKKTKA